MTAKLLAVKDDKEFFEEARKFLEASPSDKKGTIVIKLDSEGRAYRKRLYLSLAHGNFILPQPPLLC